jgi:hypothetical protein
MDFYSSLVAQATPVELEPSETSYFSAPGAGLDPRLFRDGKLIPSVRSSILRILLEHLRTHYYSPENYLTIWLAGSGVSYQWTAARHPADLDCLIGVNYLLFRQSNQQYKALSDKQIADMFNEDFRNDLQPLTKNFLDTYELTFYVNVASDIRSIKPYAAYSLTTDDWTVSPEVKAPPHNKMWDQRVARDTSMVTDILSRYSTALNAISQSTTDTARRNAEAALKLAVEQGAALFDDIHKGRTSAFSEYGGGYSDIANYRWQAGKQAGIVQALRKLKDISVKGRKSFESQTYGMELPDVNTLVRRALGGRK